MKQETRDRRQETKIRKARVAVGLSGGVDSAVSAALLQEQGYDVTGVFLMCWREPGCRTDQDRKDALSVALKLGIPFQVLDFRQAYKKRVVDYFYDEYRAGRTPNPDTMCNREIKFGLFYDWALRLRSGHAALRLGSGSSALRRTASQGLRFDYVATGHYARIVRKTRKTQMARKSDSQRVRWSEIHRTSLTSNPMIRSSDSPEFRLSESSEFSDYRLLRGVDEIKDQSYFLYQLKNEQLAHILFPVGELTKVRVRQEARRRGLPVATKPDSQGICFIGDVDVQKFLRKRLEEKPGDVVDPEGNVIGKHDGVWFYTIGQRHGFKISSKFKVKNSKFKHAIPPLYVIRKDIKKNRLVVGFGAETYQSQFAVEDCNWLSTSHIANSKWQNGIKTRIRHGGKLISSEWKVAPKYTYLLPWSTFTCRKSVTSGLRRRPQNIRVRLLEPQRGVASGQAAVFYNEDDEVLGGGVIR